MFFTEILETPDRSYYVDRLEQLTGKPRVCWAKLPLLILRQMLKKETDAKRGDSYGHEKEEFYEPV